MLRDGKVGQPSAALPLYGCRIPPAGKGCARDCARRRVSERNRRKAALSAEITQEGETGEAPPVADEASLFRGVKTTRKTGGLHKPYKGLRQTAPKGAVKRSADRI